jgi:hypothetical protein
MKNEKDVSTCWNDLGISERSVLGRVTGDDQTPLNESPDDLVAKTQLVAVFLVARGLEVENGGT